MSRKPAAHSNKKKPVKHFPWTVFWILAAVFVVLAASGFSFAATKESNDVFCGSCHTQPESTYLQRSTAAQNVDLASYHTPLKTRCIDCHSGEGVIGRISAEIMGAENAFRWYTGTAIQPAPLTHPIGDGNCMKCHSQVTQQGYVPNNPALAQLGDSENGHWHLLLSQWRLVSSNAARCVDCHGGHTTNGDPKILYLNEQQLTGVCQSCHQVLQE